MDPSRRIDLLFRMKRIRAIEETIALHYSRQRMRCPTHLCTGQEAVSAAAGMALRKDDFAVSGHRAHGHYLGKGGALAPMLAEIHGKATGCAGGKGGSMHLIDTDVGFMGSTAIVANTIPVGVGLALSAQIKGTDQITCVFFGDGAVEEGVFYESVNFAVLRQLPVLFLCENNLYSVYSPLRVRQPMDRSITAMVGPMGLSAHWGDGNDAPTVLSMIEDAVAAIRAGGGPQFLEFATYRWREHCGPNFDNDLGYRTEAEFLEWKERDPIPRLEAQLLQSGHLNAADISRREADIAAEIDRAFEAAETDPFPEPAAAFSNLYR